MNFNKWRWPVLFSVVILAISGYFLSQHRLGPQVAGIAVSKEDLIQKVTASGRVENPANIEILSKLNAKVAAVLVAEGQPVRAGQALVTLEYKADRAATEKARIATALATAHFQKISEQMQAGSTQSVQRAQSMLDHARKQYANSLDLAAKGLVSQDQTSEALRNFTVAQSKLATAQFQAKANRAKGSDYALAETALNKARSNELSLRKNRIDIKSETDGVLMSCKIARGTVVKPGKILMVIAPAGKKYVVAQLDVKNMRDLKLGQHALITADGHAGQPFTAAISDIAQPKKDHHRMFEVKLEANNFPNFVRQNMLVSVEFEVTQPTAALTLPTAVIRDLDSGEPWVMVAANGLAQRRPIKTGFNINSKTEIREGLHEGDLVLPATSPKVREGKPIRVARMY